MVEGTVLNGIDEGVWKNWWENGTQSYEGICKNGDLIKLIGRWNEDGTKRKTRFGGNKFLIYFYIKRLIPNKIWYFIVY